jgi:hypothetical protein
MTKPRAPQGMSLVALLLVACAIGTAALAQSAATKPGFHVTAKSGQEVQVTVHSSWTGTCQQKSPVAVTITKPPSNGVASTRTIEEPKPAGCAWSVPGTGVFYKSNPGFVGTDEFTYERGADAGGDSTRAGARKVSVRVIP